VPSPGFDLDGGVLAEVDASLAGYDETRGRQLQLALVDRLRAVPGVVAASIGSSFPFNGFGDSRLVAPGEWRRRAIAISRCGVRRRRT
jgi:hypothetical protein